MACFRFPLLLKVEALLLLQESFPLGKLECKRFAFGLLFLFFLSLDRLLSPRSLAVNCSGKLHFLTDAHKRLLSITLGGIERQTTAVALIFGFLNGVRFYYGLSDRSILRCMFEAHDLLK